MRQPIQKRKKSGGKNTIQITRMRLDKIILNGEKQIRTIPRIITR